MTWSFEKDQNGVRFGKCVPRFAQLWSWKCFSSANNAVIRTENCQLYIIFNWFKWSDLKCYIWSARDSAWVAHEDGFVKIRIREVVLIWLCQQELNWCTGICQSVQLALHYAHAISLQFSPSETSDNIVVKLQFRQFNCLITVIRYFNVLFTGKLFSL